MFARDLGPADNARLIALHPSRRVGVLMRRPGDGAMVIFPYDDAMEILWGVTPGALPLSF